MQSTPPSGTLVHLKIFFNRFVHIKPTRISDSTTWEQRSQEVPEV